MALNILCKCELRVIMCTQYISRGCGKEASEMMTIDNMKKRKKELGYSNEMLAERSGVPLGTVQKVFSGATPNPRYKTLAKLELALKEPLPFEYRYDVSTYPYHVAEEALEYHPLSDETDVRKINTNLVRMDSWNSVERSELWPNQGEYTTDDYYAIPDDVRVELIDGFIYDMGSPNVLHQRVLSCLTYEFSACILEHGKDCEVLSAPMDVRLDKDDRTIVEPDILVVCSPDWSDDGRYYDGAPDLVVEVLSPSTRSKDCTVKLRKYMTAGVREYWIVDPKNEKVMVYVFEQDELPTQYSFEDIIPIAISEGECSIDFSRINHRLKVLSKNS